MRYLALALCVCACSFTPGQVSPGDGGGSNTLDDGGHDGPPDGTSCTVSFSKQLDTCAAGTPGPALTLSGANQYDTSTGILATPAGPVAVTHVTVAVGATMVDFIHVEGFEIEGAGYLRVVGQHAFGVLSTGTISIGGTLDASASVGPVAGSRTQVACGDAAGVDGATDTNGAPGGSGGALGADGGDGGDGDGNQSETAGPDGGTAIAFPGIPLGGCPGGAGGTGMNAGGAGGAGGGAVDLIAAGALAVGGTITAGGGGGGPGLALTGGGGGGGSGGTILLEAATAMISGNLAANGGGGGGGAGTTNGGVGTFGQPNATVASGGAAGALGSGGGDGGTSASPAGESVDVDAPDGGAGGGGGGVGFIALDAPTQSLAGSTITPALTAWP